MRTGRGLRRPIRSACRPSSARRRAESRADPRRGPATPGVLPPPGAAGTERATPDPFQIQQGCPVSRQFIYHMRGLSKSYPGGKKVLDNVHLSFYPDAKIGVLGANGAGKSTLLRIMAGIDTEFTGEAWVAEGARVGYLPQEPQLDEQLNVLGNVMMGVKEKKDVIDRYNELMMNYSDETAEEAAKLQDKIDAENLWDLESQ